MGEKGKKQVVFLKNRSVSLCPGEQPGIRQELG